jgi:hypothetical protein
MDESDGRRRAAALGISAVGTVGVLLRAKHEWCFSGTRSGPGSACAATRLSAPRFPPCQGSPQKMIYQFALLGWHCLLVGSAAARLTSKPCHTPAPSVVHFLRAAQDP